MFFLDSFGNLILPHKPLRRIYTLYSGVQNSPNYPCPSGYFVAGGRACAVGQISGFSSRHPALSRGAYRDRHETWGGDAVDVEVPLTSGAEADGEIVWT
jgi:hypothetical protein